MKCPECDREISSKVGTATYGCPIPGCLAIRFCCPYCIITHLVKHYDKLKARHDKLVEALEKIRDTEVHDDEDCDPYGALGICKDIARDILKECEQE